jgi:adenylate cyclase
VHVAIHHGAKGEGKLLSKDDVPDQATRAYFSGKHAGVVRHVGSEFDVDGVEYFAAASHFDLGGGLAWNVGAIAPQSDFLGDLEKTTQVSLLVSAVALLLALLLATTLAGRVAAPLVNLAEEMEKVGRFELGGAPPPRSMFTEIASMNRALVAMKGGLSSFASYVPRDLVRAVLASGEEATLGGRTKPMTVFFSDLAGFTSIAEAMTPDELVSLLGTYFDEMTRAIAGNGGTIDKFIGDAVMAFWNAPVDEPKHAARACEAALACVATLRAMKTRDAAFERLSARIGIATGDALVGNIGSHDRMNYTVMGDTVNLASRLEGLGKVYGAAVLVSEATHAGASERVVMRAVDVVAVKGRVKGVRIYEPLTPRKGAPAWMLELEQLSAAALDAYVARRWSDAIAGWGRALEVDPADKPARVMRDRAAEYEKDPPGDAWSGVHVMNEK